MEWDPGTLRPLLGLRGDEASPDRIVVSPMISTQHTKPSLLNRSVQLLVVLDMLGRAERVLLYNRCDGDGEFHLLAIVCSGRSWVSSEVHTGQRALFRD